MNAAPVLPHCDALLALLRLIPNVGVYDGEVPATPPLDQDKRVKGYAVFYSGSGIPRVPALNGRSVDLGWQFTVVAVGGDQQRCLWVRDRIVAALVDVTPTVEGRVAGRICLDHEVGPPRRFDDPMPPRFSLPLLFSLDTKPLTRCGLPA